MKILQLFDFKTSRYERPNEAWVCGRKDSCESCPLGPDRKGNCRATDECQPRREEDRWHCTRTDTRGGKCPDGPRPDGSCCKPIPTCVPQRSVRSQRGIAVLLAVSLTLGAILLALGLKARDEIFNPGPRTAHHASADINCASCHTSAQMSSSDWLQAAFSKTNAHADSLRCLVCHSLGANPTQPHGLPPAQRAQLTAKALTRPVTGTAPLAIKTAAFLGGPPMGADGNLACATCHREHHGREFNLKKLSDASCQICHATNFESFNNGHPQFTNFPAVRRTRIEFDHAAHLNKYFTKAGKTFQCSDCHVPDASNRAMLVRGFETNCSSCHQDTIMRPGSKGTPVLRIPGFDRKFLEARVTTLGDWPADADGAITPFMKVLLAGDPATSKAMTALQGVDLLALSSATPEATVAAEQLAWGVKELFADLIVSGHDALKKRLGEKSAATLGQLPAELVNTFTQADWWPNLLIEVAAHRAGQKLPGHAAPVAAESTKPVAVAASRTPTTGAKPAGDDDILGGDEKPIAVASTKTADDDIIGDDKPAAKPAQPAKAADDDIGDDIPAAGTKAAQAKKAEPAAVAPERVAPEKWVSAGGWHVSPNEFSINYRASGHGDAFLKSWLELGATRAADAPARQVFTEIAENASCMKCHSVDNAAGHTLAVNWKSGAPKLHDHTFVKFSHGAHYNSVDGQSCQNCHKLDASVNYTASFKDNFDPAKFVSSFRQLQQNDCARCHSAKVVGNSCQLCHAYHIGEFMPTKLTGS